MFVLVTAMLSVFRDPWSFAITLATSALYLFVLMRFGFLAFLFLLLWTDLLLGTPISFDSSAWYTPYGYAILALCAAIVVYAFRTSLAGRPFFGTVQLDD